MFFLFRVLWLHLGNSAIDLELSEILDRTWLYDSNLRIMEYALLLEGNGSINNIWLRARSKESFSFIRNCMSLFLLLISSIFFDTPCVHDGNMSIDSNLSQRAFSVVKYTKTDDEFSYIMEAIFL